MLSHAYLERATQRYDFIVVDEVQDLTIIQLYLLLQALRSPTEFILCGDSNQIVHPNFFSWAKVNTLFYEQKNLQKDHQPKKLLYILHTNYRNSSQVTELANRVLKIK